MNRKLDLLKKQVKLENHVWIAPNATVLGNISIGQQSSIWYGAVLRADSDIIKIGARTNVQDNAVLHQDPGFPLMIGSDFTIGHAAVVHGCITEDACLIVMNATIMNGARIEKYCIVGANALVTENMQIPDYSLVLGASGRVVKRLDESIHNRMLKNAAVYVNKTSKYLSE